jgi:hypothetical protein
MITIATCLPIGLLVSIKDADRKDARKVIMISAKRNLLFFWIGFSFSIAFEVTLPERPFTVSETS